MIVFYAGILFLVEWLTDGGEAASALFRAPWFVQGAWYVYLALMIGSSIRARRMSSSTSSSEMTLRGRALRIALMFVVALVLVEVGTRPGAGAGFQGSGPTTASFPDPRARLAAAPATRIVFIGDSVTDRIELERTDGPMGGSTGDSPEPSTSSWPTTPTWRPGTGCRSNTSGSRDLKPDLIVVTYYDENGSRRLAGPGRRQSRPVFHRQLMIAHLCSKPDLKTFRQRADYMLSSVSLAYAMRVRIQRAHDSPNSTVQSGLRRRRTSSISSTSSNTLRSRRRRKNSTTYGLAAAFPRAGAAGGHQALLGCIPAEA